MEELRNEVQIEMVDIKRNSTAVLLAIVYVVRLRPRRCTLSGQSERTLF